jgi:hypothetical protein
MDLDGGIELLQLALVGLEVVRGIVAEVDSTSTIVSELVCRSSANTDRAVAACTECQRL